MLLNESRNKNRQLELLKALSDEAGKWDMHSSKTYARRVLILAQALNDDLGIAQFNTVIARNEYLLGNYKESLNLYLKSLAIYEQIDDIKGVIGVNVNLGAIYDRLSDEERALAYYQKALNDLNSKGQFILKERPEFKTVLYNNIASIYNNMGDVARHREYIQEALRSALEMKDYHTLGVIYNNLGLNQVKRKDFGLARQYFQKSIDTRQRIGDLDGLAKAHQFMVEYYLALNQIDSARWTALKAQGLAMKIGSLETQMNCSQALCQVYERMGMYDQALVAHKNYTVLNDSIKNDKIIRQAFQLQSNYELAKYERQVYLEKQKMRFVFVLVTLLLVFIIVVVLLLLVIRQTKNKKTLLEKKQLENEMQMKNKEFATNVLYLVRKNELINSVAKKLLDLKENMKPELKPSVQRIILELQSEVDNEVWQEFEYRFQQVHLNFYSELRSRHPELTPSEERLCAFLRLNMSTKEIASITHQNVKSIEVSRARVRKKFNLTNTDANLIGYLAEF
ncbi:MAG: tetratricopeptide repeat protein [Breznakibacter sp.]|nr:tetratricopeptide repeat protein [Breznakibacter sp.]